MILLESGGQTYEPATQALYDCDPASPQTLDVSASRLRYWGGTTNHWGGWCKPLDPIDFEDRPGLPYRGWPVTRADLDPWYAQAQQILQLGPFDYDPRDWGLQGDSVPAPFMGPHLFCDILQNSPPTRFAAQYGPDLDRSSAVTVYLHANARRFNQDHADGKIASLSVKTLAGNEFSVTAGFYVLATGGIENPRLLLASTGPNGQAPGNEHDLVGRFLMVHLEYDGGIVAVADPYTNFDFFPNTHTNDHVFSSDGQRFTPFIGLSETTLREQALPNLRITWHYEYLPEKRTADAVRHLLHFHAPTAISDIETVWGDLAGVRDIARRWYRGQSWVPVKSLRLQISSESLPNPESRVSLGHERDALDMPRVLVDWRLTGQDYQKGLQVQRLIAAEVGRSGLGRLRTSFGQDGQTWPDDFYGNEHHMGTTRIHADPRQGVVDANCRVHGLANLFIAGSSVFPTAGNANPTLTITALALRLADHLNRSMI